MGSSDAFGRMPIVACAWEIRSFGDGGIAERTKAVLKRVSGHFKSRIKFGKSSPSAVPGANARLFQWMGWPVGPQYAASSNVENAAKLQGKLLLIVGELDTNGDPSSTLQVANAPH
jgi:hypothetical protein